MMMRYIRIENKEQDEVIDWNSKYCKAYDEPQTYSHS